MLIFFIGLENYTYDCDTDLVVIMRKKNAIKKKGLTTLHFTCFGIIILLLTALNLLVYFSPHTTIVVAAKDTTPEQDAYYLQNLLLQNPTYRDGWVQLAKLEFYLGNTKEAQNAVRKVIELDPNYSEIEYLTNLLNNN